ncbi:DUF6118 family protein [Sphingopyxis sp. MWB1]|uniref:DUF6118 family protein n=1 Tax=Sphingopyxis sp. MWB1 TaxID=1537715 RepID=UPI00051A3015|nr:DUF6118 family protein [Sphingopyxis sp. MWB1]
MTTDDQTAQPQDPAAAAFTRLESQIALMRRAVENLATEKANIDIPDYSDTLGEMAESLAAVADTLDTIAAKPAMAMTPEGMAQRMDQAARSARQSDREQIAAAETRYDDAMRDLTKIVASAWSASYQREYLRWAACGGVLAGCLLWAIVPGILARQLPESWHMPERIAMRTLREPSVWDAGVRLLKVGSPLDWRAISDAAEMRGRNKKTIADCERAAEKSKKVVRCRVTITPP